MKNLPIHNNMNKLLYAFAILVVAGCAASRNNSSAPIELNGVFDQYARESYSLNPLSATANNVNDYNDQLAINISEPWVEKVIQFNHRYLDTLKKLDHTALTDLEKRSV